MKYEKGDTVFHKDEMGCLEPGVFMGFADMSEEKALISIERGYKTVATKDLIRVTVIQLEIFKDKFKRILKKYRETKPPVMT